MSSARLSPDVGYGAPFCDPRVAEMIQKLEATCQRVLTDEALSVLKRDPTSAVCLPERLKEIIEESLSPLAWSKVLTETLASEEVEYLKQELDKAHSLLAQLQKDRQELGSKYIAVSSKIEKMLEMEQSIHSLSSHVDRLEQEKEILQNHMRSQESSHASEAMVLHREHESLISELKQQLEGYKAKYVGLEADLALQQMSNESGVQQLMLQLEDKRKALTDMARKLNEKESAHREELEITISNSEEHMQRANHLVESNGSLHKEIKDLKTSNLQLNDSVVLLTAQLGEARKMVALQEKQCQEALENRFPEDRKSSAGYMAEMAAYKSALDEVMLFIQDHSHSDSSPRGMSPSFTPQRDGQSSKGGLSTVLIGSQDSSTATPKRPIWIGGMPQPIGTAGDSTRLKEWFVNSVRSALDKKQETIKDLQSELSSVKDAYEQEWLAKRDLEGEMRSQSSALTLLKKDLDSNRDGLSVMTFSRDDLDKQLMEMKSEKVMLEQNLSQLKARFDALSSDKKESEDLCQDLREGVRNLQFQVDQVKQDKDRLENELESKLASTKKLDQELSSTQEESRELRHKASRLDADKMETQRDVTSLKLTVQRLEMEKDTLLRRLKQQQESETDIVSSLDGVQEARRIGQEKVAQLSSEVERLQGVKQRLDQDNTQLTREKLEAMNEITKLQHIQTQVGTKVDHLEKQLNRSHAECKDLSAEITQLKEESSNLTDALGKTKQCLAEVQVQRGKLAGSVAKIAQEKSELIRERVTLKSQIAQAEELLQGTQEKTSALETTTGYLSQKITVLETSLSLSESSHSALSESHDQLKQEKQSLAFEHSLCSQQKEKEVHSMATRKEQQLQRTLGDAQHREMELQSAMEESGKEAERKLSEQTVGHQAEVRTLVHNQEELLGELRAELQSLQQQKDKQVERLTLDRETATLKLTEEKKMLYDRLSQLQKLLDQKTEESRHQQQQAYQLIAEQRQQLETSQLDAERVSREFAQAEGELKELRRKMDSLKVDADGKVEDLTDKLRSAAQTISSLEEGQSDAHVRLREVETRRDSFKRQVSEQQRQIEAVQEEREILQKECNGLRVRLLDNERELDSLVETVQRLEGSLTSADDERLSNRDQVEELQEALKKAHASVAKLTSESTQLQSGLSTAEGRSVSLEVEVRHALGRLKQSQQEKEELAYSLAGLQNKLESTARLSASREQEKAALRQKISNLELERENLFTTVNKLQEDTKLQGQTDAVRISELHAQVSSLRSEKDLLMQQIEKMKTEIETYQKNLARMESEVATTSGKMAALSTHFDKVDLTKKDLQNKYARLMGILQGTLGLDGQQEVREESPGSSFDQQSDKLLRSSFPTPQKRVSRESGIGASFLSSHASLSASPTPLTNTTSWSSSTHTSPCKLLTIQVGEESVKEAILSLQRRVLAAEQAKEEGTSQIRGLFEEINKLEGEKTALERNLANKRVTLQNIQAQLDKSSSDRGLSEQNASSLQLALSKTKNRVKELEATQTFLEEQNAQKEMQQQMSATKLKKYKENEAGLMGESNALADQLQRADSRVLDLQSNLTRVKKQVSSLESDKMLKEARIESLEQKLRSTEDQLREGIQMSTELKEQLKAANRASEGLMSEGERLRISISQAKDQAGSAELEQAELRVSLEDLQFTLDAVEKEKEGVEKRLELVLQAKDEDVKHLEVLRKSIRDLQEQLARKTNSCVELQGMLKETERQALKQQQKIDAQQAMISDQQKQKVSLVSQLSSLETDVSSVEHAKHVSQDLAGHLEKELTKTRASYQKLQGDNCELRAKLDNSLSREQHFEVLLTTQRKQKAEVDISLTSSSQHHEDLQQKIRQLENSISSKERGFKKKLGDYQADEVTQRVEQVQAQYRLQRQQWTDKEVVYKGTIEKLETKVHLLHGQINEDNKKTVEYPNLATSFDGEVKSMRSSRHLSSDYPQIPTPQLEGNEGQRLSSSGLADFGMFSPLTSTPAKATSSSSRSFLHLSASPLRPTGH